MLHPLTTEQLRMLIDAYGDGKNPPKHTDDPRVNYAVDCIVSNDDEEPYDAEIEQSYIDEIKAVKAAGL